MSDNEALNELVTINRNIKNDTYNLNEAFNHQLALYDTPILALLESGDKYNKEIIAQNNKIIDGQIMIVMSIVMLIIFNFVTRCLK